MSNKISRYSDIINLPHHQSVRRPHMSVYNRAAQFAPFAALVGYDEMVQDTADYRLLEQRIILSEDEKAILDRKLQTILECINENPEIRLFYFDEAVNKLGGEYVVYSGKVKKIEELLGIIVFVDGKKICLDDIIRIEIPLEQKENS